MTPGSPSQILARNLDLLLSLKGLGRKEAAHEIGVPYKWLRQVVTKGIARPDRRNAAHLQKIVECFGLASIDDLWRPGLVELRLDTHRGGLVGDGTPGPERVAAQGQLADLLSTGRHQYLCDLLDDLHRREFPEPARTPQAPDRRAGGKSHLQHVLIKWTGSKRRQARRIVEHFPRRIGTYFEPFLGGGSVLGELLDGDIEVGRVECSDTCVPLVELWQVVRDDPDGLIRRYGEMWCRLREGGAAFYYDARDRFNRKNDPYLFFFLLRTCRNGLVRFNRAGEFNTGFHGGRPGMGPGTVEALVEGWRRRLGSREVRFAVRDYGQVSTSARDLLYLDPPYRTPDGQYYSGMIDFPEFFGWLRRQRGDSLLSLNGFLGDEDRTVEVPGDLYDRHVQVGNGINPFDRLNGKVGQPVSDSLYIKVGRTGRSR